jgi:hypothetical protein
MKHLFFLIVFSIAFFFCKNKSNNNAELKNELIKSDSIFRISEHYSKFKFHDLTEFEMDTFHFDGASTKHYTRLDSVACIKVFQNINEDWLSKTFFYYSTFKDPTLIAILEESDEWGFIIWLLKYNEKGVFQSKVAIANYGGDAGEHWESYGKCVDNQEFNRTDIMLSQIGDDIENSDIEFDSTIVNIKFNKNNKPQIETIFKNQEIIKNKK